MQDIFLKYGITGAVIVALAWYILRIEDRHRKERKEYADRLMEQERKNQEITGKMFDKMIESTDKNTNILSGLKTILENKNRNGR